MVAVKLMMTIFSSKGRCIILKVVVVVICDT